MHGTQLYSYQFKSSSSVPINHCIETPTQKSEISNFALVLNATFIFFHGSVCVSTSTVIFYVLLNSNFMKRIRHLSSRNFDQIEIRI